MRAPHEWWGCAPLKRYATLWDELRTCGNIWVFYEEGNSEGRAVIPQSMVPLVLNSLTVKRGVIRGRKNCWIKFGSVSFGPGGPRT